MDTKTADELYLIGGTLIMAGFVLTLLGGMFWAAAKGWLG